MNRTLPFLLLMLAPSGTFAQQTTMDPGGMLLTYGRLSDAMAFTCAGLRDAPEKPVHRDYYEQLLPQIEYPAVLEWMRGEPLNSFDMLTPFAKWKFIFLVNAAAAGALILWLIGRWRLGRLAATILLVISSGFFAYMLHRDRAIARYFHAEMLVINEPCNLYSGNGPHFDTLLPAALPAGHILKAAGERGGWLRVEYAPGKVGWVDEKAVIKVADRKMLF